MLHLLIVEVLLLHVRPKLGGVRAHEVHDLVVGIHVDHCGVRGVVVRLDVPGVDVVRHVSRSSGQFCNVVPLLECRVPQTYQSRLSDPLSVLGFCLRIGQPFQLSAVLRCHASHLSPIDPRKVFDVRSHCRSGLPLLIQHFSNDLHIRHLWTACIAGQLPNANLLGLNSVPPLLRLIERILIASEL